MTAGNNLKVYLTAVVSKFLSPDPIPISVGYTGPGRITENTGFMMRFKTRCLGPIGCQKGDNQSAIVSLSSIIVPACRRQLPTGFPPAQPVLFASG